MQFSLTSCDFQTVYETPGCEVNNEGTFHYSNATNKNVTFLLNGGFGVPVAPGGEAFRTVKTGITYQVSGKDDNGNILFNNPVHIDKCIKNLVLAQ
ncbi:MAG: hypothetical protein RLZZ292_1676 [Bacteroidota bacterium]|jgi:hypothetical protein